MTTTVEPMLPEKVPPGAQKSTSKFGQFIATISGKLIYCFYYSMFKFNFYNHILL